jgi:hypothetical protein
MEPLQMDILVAHSPNGQTGPTRYYSYQCASAEQFFARAFQAFATKDLIFGSLAAFELSDTARVARVEALGKSLRRLCRSDVSSCAWSIHSQPTVPQAAIDPGPKFKGNPNPISLSVKTPLRLLLFVLFVNITLYKLGQYRDACTASHKLPRR